MKPIRILVYLLFILQFTVAIYAQTSMDSLKNLSNSKIKNEAWIDAMILNVEKIINSEPKTAFTFSKRIIEASNKLSYKKGFENSTIQNAQILYNLGKYDEAEKQIKKVLKKLDDNDFNKIQALIILNNVFYNRGEFDAALNLLKDAEGLIIDKKNELVQATIYNNKAKIYLIKGDYNLTIQNNLKAAEIFERLNKKKSLAIVYNNLGNLNADFKFYDKSIKYFNLAIKINKTVGDFYNLSQNYANLGVTYKSIDSISKAIVYYEKSLAISEKLGSSLVMAQNYVNLGNIYEKQGSYKKAFEVFNKSLEICKKEKIIYGFVLNYANIGNTHFLNKNYDDAIISLDSAIKYAEILELPKEKSQIYERLTNVYKAKNNFEKAFEYQSLFNEINDSLISAEKHNQFAELQTKYETANKEKVILKMSEKEIKHKLTIVYLIILSLILSLFGGWIFYKRKKSLQENKIAEITADKMKLEIQLINNELTQKTLNIVNLKENNLQIVSEIEELIKSKSVTNNEMAKIVNKIKFSSKSSAIWEEFDLRFKTFHSDFYSKIIRDYPDLSPVELRIVTLLRLNLTSKEISEIMQRSIKTIENNRGLIRKKMNLDAYTNLTSFISKL